MNVKPYTECAFTLVEMALVLLVLGILTRAAVLPLTHAEDHKRRRHTTVQLSIIKDSLLAHVVATGTLPCPAKLTHAMSGTNTLSARSSLTSFREAPSFITDNQTLLCMQKQGGVPAGVLGLAGMINDDGALLDTWKRPYRYAISLASHAERGSIQLPDWTSTGEATRVGIAELFADITLCRQAHRKKCPTKDIRANQVVFVVFSQGPDASSDGYQYENVDNDQEFVVHEESKEPATRYDDQMIWATAPDILYWMLRSGWLP